MDDARLYSGIAVTYGTSPAVLITRLGLPAGADPGTSLKSVAEQNGQAPFDYTQRVQRVIAELVPVARSDGTGERATWLATISDAALTALLVYGYPVLGLTLLLCALGAPLPDEFATVVAGSFIAQGRMTWLWAGAVAVAASVLGDTAAYGLGRWLDRGVLERQGIWLGYTRARRARVQALLDRWGALTVLLTRTLVPSLGSIMSLLAGAGHYRLPEFLALAFVGRLLWTVASLGLGYGIGPNPDAAADFLVTLSGLLLSVFFVAGTAAVVSGRFAQMSAHVPE